MLHSVWVSCVPRDASLPPLGALDVAWHEVFPVFPRQHQEEKPHFPSLSPSSLLVSVCPPLVTFFCCLLVPSCVVLPRSPTHHLLSLTLNELIPPVPLPLNTRVWSNFSVEVTHRVLMWQRWFFMVSTWAGYLRSCVTVGNWLFSQCSSQGKQLSLESQCILMNFNSERHLHKTNFALRVIFKRMLN